MSFKELFDLKDNPFRMTPAIKPDEIVWAGFSKLKEDLKLRIRRSMQISSSSLILNWGEYGSGKTHAANYFNRDDVLKKIARDKNCQTPFSFKITLSTSRHPIFDLFISLIDHIDIEEIRKKFEDISEEIQQFIDSFTRNITVKNVLMAFFCKANKNIEDFILKKYLFNTISNKEFEKLSNFKILRKLESDEDRTKVLAGIFSCLTYNQKKYSNITIWIDEFETISLLNNVNTEATNKFIRDILENTPNHLLVFLNFTMSATASYEDLGLYLSRPVISRIRDRIEFKIPDEKELKIYLEELLNNKLYREKEHEHPFYPFTEEAVDFVINKLGAASIRDYNEAFSILLELAEFDNKSPITRELTEEYEDDIIGWK